MSEAYKRDRRGRGGGTETRRRLLDAGLAVFADRGYHAARVDDIVRAAETSHGTFYLYFSNKEELLRELATVCAHDLRSAATALHGDGDQLAAFIAAFM